MNPHRRRGQPALPASSDTADSEVDILEVGEERRVEPADFEECGPIEGRGPAAGREWIEDGSLQNLHRLAVEVIEPVEGPVDDDAGRVDPVLGAATHENR